jgi:hypothetical protein
MNDHGSKTVIGLFDDIGDARSAVQELLDNGFPKDSVNLVAHAAAQEYTDYFDNQGHYTHLTPESVGNHVEAAAKVGGIGAVIGGLGGLLLGLSLVAIPGVGPVVAAGPFLAALVGAGAGASVGGMIGGFTNVGVPEVDAEAYAEAIRRGGSSVVVRASIEEATRAAQLLKNHNPVDIQHRINTWRQSGWNRFDPSAQPYTAEQIAAERRAYINQGNATV